LADRSFAAGAGVGDEAAEEDDLEAAGGQDTSMLGKLLQQQTLLLTHLARKQQDPLQMLLGGGTDGGDGDFKAGGIKGMAARQLLQEQFAKQPMKVYQRVRERLALARRKATRDLEPRDMYLHFQETVPLGNFKTLTYLAFLMAEMFEAAERGQSDELLGLLASGLVFCEQVAAEQGHTRLAWLLTCREDPPFALVEQRRAPRAEVPHGHLADPRWVAAQLGYLKDVDAIQERTSKSHAPRTAPVIPPGGGDEGPAKRPPRGRGKGGRQTEETTS
jgi:hypothetical protein